MSLLDDLQNIDLSGIVSAKASISVSIQTPGLQAAISGGAAQTALAGLGGSLGSVRSQFSSPEALLKPIVDAVGAQSIHFDSSKVSLGDLESAIASGLGMIVEPIKAIVEDPVSVVKLLPFDLSQVTAGLRSAAPGFSQTDLSSIGRFRSLFDMLDGDLPTDPSAFAKIALEALMPFPGLDLHGIRAGIDRLHAGIGGIHLPAERASGLVIALDAVASAANSGDASALKVALGKLEQVRLSTIHAIETELFAVVAAIDKLHLQDVLGLLTQASAALRAAEGGILELFEKWRLMIQAVRKHVEAFDATEILHFIDSFVAMAEDFAHNKIGAQFDAAAAKLEKWVRDLFAHLPIVEFRNDISAFFHKAAQAIADAHLDAVANEIHAALEAVRSKLDANALTADVQGALQAIRETIHEALDKVIGALTQVTDEINAVADTAVEILTRTAKALTDFKTAIDSITQTVEHLGVREAAEQVVNTIAELRKTAEKLLAVAPLPESMRPTVQQLIDGLNSVDFNAVFKPVEDAAKQFHIPDEEKATITAGLQKAAEAVSNLIPEQLIAEIDAEIKSALDTITGFNPAALLPDVSQYLDEAADFITSLDPRPHVTAIRAPYLAVLEALDKVRPEILLDPVIKGYDTLMGQINPGSSDSFMSKLGDTLSSAVNKAGDAVTSPLNNLLGHATGGAISSGAGSGAPTGSGQTGGAPSGGPSGPPAEPPGTTGSGPPAPPPGPFDGKPIHPGDLIRVFGFIPAKVREGLHALDAGAAGQALRELDSLGAGLARDLREIKQALLHIEAGIAADLDSMLLPVSAAQLRAQVAVQGKFRADGVTLHFALDGIALAGPTAIKGSLVESAAASRARIKQASGTAASSAGAAIDRLATALERSKLASLTGDLDALLAALDPEPLAVEVDALAEAMFKKAPEILEDLRATIDKAFSKIEALLSEFNPGVQAQKFLTALKPLTETLDLLNPRRLADELGEIHAEIRKALVANDPAVIAEDIAVTLEAIAGGIRALDPATLLGDLSFLDDIAAKVEAASPTKALQGVGTQLTAVGQQLTDLDPAGLLTAIEGLAPKMVDAFKLAADAIRNEVVALLESLKYGMANASVSASVSVG